MADLYGEVGTTGAPIMSQDSYASDRYLDRLKGPSGIELLARMLQSEPAAFTLNRAQMLTAKGATWSCSPASTSAADKKAADFVNSLLDDMTTSWWTSTRFALSSMAYGFADMMIVYKRRLGKMPRGDSPASAYDDGAIGLRKLAIRRQETIERWIRDENGGPQAMVQRNPETGLEYPPVPIERILHFRTNDDRGGWEGAGWLVPAYKMAYMIDALEKLYGIGQQRSHVGLPVFAYKAKPSDDTKANVRRIGRGLSVNEQQYVEYPSSEVDFNLITTINPNATETREMIGQLRWDILMTGMAQFLRLGSTNRGAQSLADPLINMFCEAVQSALDEVQDTFNRHLIPRVLAVNPSIAAGITEYPQLVHTSVTQPPTQVLQFLDQIGRFLAIATPEDDEWLRSIVNMPEEVTYAPTPANDANTDNTDNTDQEDTAPENDQPDTAAAKQMPFSSSFHTPIPFAQIAAEYLRSSELLRAAVNGHAIKA